MSWDRRSSDEAATPVVAFVLEEASSCAALDFPPKSGGGIGEVSSVPFLETAGVSYAAVGEV